MQCKILGVTLAIFGGLLLVLATVPAKSMAVRTMFAAYCMPKDELKNSLRDRHQESMVAAGVLGNGEQSAELWLNKMTGSFSISMSKGEQSCIVFTGQSWIDFEPVIQGDLM